MKVPVRNEGFKSVLIPFIFGDGQAAQLEFTANYIRVIEDGGILVRAPVSVTGVSGTTQMVITAPGHGTVAGEQVALNDFPASTNLNNRVALVASVAGDDVTLLDVSTPPGVFSFAGATISRVFQIATDYTTSEIERITSLQSNDIMYLFCNGRKPRQLVRNSAYDWVLSDMALVNGPYLDVNKGTTRLTLASHGGTIPFMSDNTTPSGTASANENNTDAFKAFDGLDTTYWTPITAQGGTLQYDFTGGKVLSGYYIAVPSSSVDDPLAGAPDGEQNALGYAPYSWTVEGWDGAAWIVLDSQIAYDAWDGRRSVFIDFANAVAVTKVRLVITATRTSGTVTPRIATFAVFAAGDATASFNLTASSVSGINSGLGFLTTDVGRWVRIKGEDGYWRDLKITGRTSTTVVTAQLQGDPFPTARSTGEWRLGYWSDTTGWPTVAAFFDDRLWLGGVGGYSNVVFGSVTGVYTNYRQTLTSGAVADDNAIVAILNSRRRPIITWLESDERGLIIGTQGGPWVLGTQSAEGVLSGRNAKVRQVPARGSAAIRPVKVDRAILFVQKSKRTVRELAYVFEVDGYKVPSLSIYAQHLGASTFEEMDYQAEPNSIVWVRRADGQVAALTYNRDENVIGWSLHDFGGVVESLSVMPDPDLTQDAVWMIIRRDVNGVTRRFIEKLTRVWDLSMTLADAHYADCALRYDGDPATVFYGLHYLEGATVDGLADGNPFPSQIVSGGKLTLTAEASSVVVGLGYQADLECSRIEAGAADGTAQGKTKRIHDMTLRLYASGPALVGRVDEEGEKLDPLELRRTEEYMAQVPLFTGDLNIPFPAGYDKSGTVLVRKEANSCLPVNVVALMPHIDTQDSG